MLLEQISADFEMKEHLITKQFEDQIQALVENLDKKENQIQQKEKKWMEIERVVMVYAAEDEELKQRFRELRFVLIPDAKISSTVAINTKLETECALLHEEINRLRQYLTDPFLHYDKLQDKISKHQQRKAADSEPIERPQMESYDVGSNAQKIRKHVPKEM